MNTKLTKKDKILTKDCALVATGTRLGYGAEDPPFVKPTLFWKEFVKYLKK